MSKLDEFLKDKSDEILSHQWIELVDVENFSYSSNGVVFFQEKRGCAVKCKVCGAVYSEVTYVVETSRLVSDPFVVSIFDLNKIVYDPPIDCTTAVMLTALE